MKHSKGIGEMGNRRNVKVPAPEKRVVGMRDLEWKPRALHPMGMISGGRFGDHREQDGEDLLRTINDGADFIAAAEAAKTAGEEKPKKADGVTIEEFNRHLGYVEDGRGGPTLGRTRINTHETPRAEAGGIGGRSGLPG